MSARLWISPGIHCRIRLFRHVHHSARTSQQQPPKPPPRIDGATEISHSEFLHSATPESDFNPSQYPSAGASLSSPSSSSSSPVSSTQGRLDPTNSHLFKLILPLPTSLRRSPTPSSSSSSSRRPTAFLLHPSQPLSHLSRLITGSLPPAERNADITYLALTGKEEDLESHLRSAEEEEEAAVSGRLKARGGLEGERQEGGPYLGERQKNRGRWQEVSWSQSTDLSDFIKQSCLNERFKIVIEPEAKSGEEASKAVGKSGDEKSVESKEASGPESITIEVIIPSFASRTTFLRARLLSLTKDLDKMTKQKKAIDLAAHKSAQRLGTGALAVGVLYWGAIVRWTFFTDAGWDMMEPVTWATGFFALLCGTGFLIYHNREVSYSSLLDLSITARQRSLYDKHGLDIEKWTEMVTEAKTLRREIVRIAADYDIEWQGELETLANMEKYSHPSARLHYHTPSASSPTSSSSSPSSASARSDAQSQSDNGKGSNEQQEGEKDEDDDSDEKIDIDKTIDEASEMAERTKEKADKAKDAERKGEAVDKRRAAEEGGEDGGEGERKKGEKGEERGKEKARKLIKEGR